MNRHNYFIQELEALVEELSELNVLSRFELQKANEYQYPYCYVELQNEILDYPYEDFYNAKGEIDFVLWIGIETSSDGDLRTVYGDLTEKIESKFKGIEFDSLNATYYNIDSCHPRITGLYPVSNFTETRFLYVVTGKILYDISWK